MCFKKPLFFLNKKFIFSYRLLFGSIVFVSLILLFRCKSAPDSKDVLDFSTIDLGEESSNAISKTHTNDLPIFYNLYLTGEMTQLFDTLGLTFDDNILNSTDQITEYITTYKKALNIGVYAADLSYTKVFNQYEVSEKYFNAMQKLAMELGIPGEFMENTAKRFDRNIANKDSLIMIANEVFMATDEYLKANERQSAATLIILGGWIEAMNIATTISDNYTNHMLFERISEQRSSLNDLIKLLESSEPDEVIKKQLSQLYSLKKEFKKFQYDYTIDYSIDSPETKNALKENREQIQKLHTRIHTIRQDIISSISG